MKRKVYRLIILCAVVALAVCFYISDRSGQDSIFLNETAGIKLLLEGSAHIKNQGIGFMDASIVLDEELLEQTLKETVFGEKGTKFLSVKYVGFDISISVAEMTGAHISGETIQLTEVPASNNNGQTIQWKLTQADKVGCFYTIGVQGGENEGKYPISVLASIQLQCRYQKGLFPKKCVVTVELRENRDIQYILEERNEK